MIVLVLPALQALREFIARPGHSAPLELVRGGSMAALDLPVALWATTRDAAV